MQQQSQTLLTLRALADRLKLPADWLKAEALAGRIPSLRAGRRILFNAAAVELLLLDRATQPNIENRGQAASPNGDAQP